VGDGGVGGAKNAEISLSFRLLKRGTLKTRYFLLKKGKKGGVPFRPEPFFTIFR
jgi:hypothetical protein